MRDLHDKFGIEEISSDEKIRYWMRKFKETNHEYQDLLSLSLEVVQAYNQRFVRHCGPIDPEIEALDVFLLKDKYE